MREMGKALSILLAAYLTVFAWVASVLFYQVIEGGSVFWIAVSLVAAAFMAAGFVYFARKTFRRISNLTPRCRDAMMHA